jgi:hypothetical protein
MAETPTDAKDINVRADIAYSLLICETPATHAQ